MKKLLFIVGMLVCSSAAFAQTHKHTQKKAEVSKDVYQCPMKCEGTKTYTKKGKCPACTMELKLVKK